MDAVYNAKNLLNQIHSDHNFTAPNGVIDSVVSDLLDIINFNSHLLHNTNLKRDANRWKAFIDSQSVGNLSYSGFNVDLSCQENTVQRITLDVSSQIDIPNPYQDRYEKIVDKAKTLLTNYSDNLIKKNGKYYS